MGPNDSNETMSRNTKYYVTYFKKDIANLLDDRRCNNDRSQQLVASMPKVQSSNENHGVCKVWKIQSVVL